MLFLLFLFLSIYFFDERFFFSFLYLTRFAQVLPKNEWKRAIFLVLESTLNFFIVLQKCIISQIII